MWMAVVLWGSVWVVLKHLLENMGPATLTFLRFVFAATVMAVVALQRPAVFRAALRNPVLMRAGVVAFAFCWGIEAFALQYTTAGAAALLQAALPLATAVLSNRLPREPLSRRSWGGLVLAVAGLALVTGSPTSGGRLEIAADILIVAGVISFSAYLIPVRRRGAIDPPLTSAAAMAWGTVFLLPWFLGELIWQGFPPISVLDWLALVYLGGLATAAPVLFSTFALRTLNAAVVGLFLAATPAVGYLLALLAGETPAVGPVVGGIMGVVGVAVGTSSAARTPALPPAPFGPPPEQDAPPRKA